MLERRKERGSATEAAEGQKGGFANRSVAIRQLTGRGRCCSGRAALLGRMVDEFRFVCFPLSRI